MVLVFLRTKNVDDGVEEMVRYANGASFSTEENKKHIEKGGHSIFKVPHSLRKLELDAFVPHIVSIGPYHRNKEHLKEMETYKRILLEHVIKRAGKQFENEFKDLKEKMSKFEEDTRRHYNQYFDDIKDFAEMMLLDSCFILELFCVDVHGWTKYEYKSDPSSRLNMKGFMPFIRRDLLMLENQLPLFLLQEMFALLDWKEKTPNESIHSLAIEFFKKLIPGISINLPKHPENRPPPPHPKTTLPPPTPSHPEIGPSSPPHQENGPPSCLHLLHIIHQSLKPSSQDIEENGVSESALPEPENKQDDDKTEHWLCTHGNCLISYPISPPCFSLTICAQDSELDKVLSPSSSSSNPSEIVMHSVTSLRSMGIKFEEYKNWKKFTDIEYNHNDGKLLIPRLHINGSTKSIFLNLMVFEQGSPYCSRYITSYTSFMDGLIDSPKDAHHLIEKRIISHELGSEDDVSSLFNTLRREIYFELVPNDYYLSDVSQKLNQHYQQKWRGWIATLKHEYLKDPWKTTSLLAAALLIFLTAAQTTYTVVGYHFPRP